jgi:hypothetical protein
MRAFVTSLSLAAAAFCAAAPAQAYTPESGTWWNPNEPGTGIFIEVQDNFLVAAAFLGDANRNPIWYTATNFLTGNARFDGTLDLTRNVQCPGCLFPGPANTTEGAGGTIRLIFDPNDPTKAQLTWGNGRTIAYERFPFYLKRPEDPSGVPLKATMMLGEWQMVMDFSESSASSFAYYGDVLVFDQYEFDNPTGRWYFDGCRADDSEVGGCSNNALAFHSASGFYNTSSKLHAIVVDDSRDNYALYLIETGTNSGSGEITVYPKGRDPSNYDSYPMRSFRTASRTFVEEGTGPSKAAPFDAAAKVTGIADRLAPAGIQPRDAAPATSKFDRAALLPEIRALEAKLEAKKRKLAAAQ